MIQGEKIYLKAIEAADLTQLKEWRNLTEYRKHFREYREINDVMQQRWFEKFVCSDPNTIMFSIFLHDTGELIGCCGLCYINWVHRNADLSLYMGYENSYIDDKGFAAEACQLLFRYGFRELNLHKIWTEIYEFDEKKKRLYDTFGFVQDGMLRENYFYDGRWWDSRIISLLQKDFK